MFLNHRCGSKGCFLTLKQKQKKLNKKNPHKKHQHVFAGSILLFNDKDILFIVSIIISSNVFSKWISSISSLIFLKNCLNLFPWCQIHLFHLFNSNLLGKRNKKSLTQFSTPHTRPLGFTRLMLRSRVPPPPPPRDTRRRRWWMYKCNVTAHLLSVDIRPISSRHTPTGLHARAHASCKHASFMHTFIWASLSGESFCERCRSLSYLASSIHRD